MGTKVSKEREDMKVRNDKGYSDLEPEKYNWSLIDSRILEPIVGSIVSIIRIELRKPPGDRELIAGLRSALQIISNHAEVS
jgi:hypothetical protein